MLWYNPWLKSWVSLSILKSGAFRDLVELCSTRCHPGVVFVIYAGYSEPIKESGHVFMGSHIAHKEIISSLFPCRAIKPAVLETMPR